ncbi:MAG: hypothetical protein NTX65_13360 [Ignavibacteriales bacterium]|nr:hypothetical protein [Ignavibacteriales bacterium]
MSLLKENKNDPLGEKNKITPEDDDLSFMIKNDLENILEKLGSDENALDFKKKISLKLADLGSTMEGIKDYREALDSFSTNLEKILKDWDSNDDTECDKQLGN